MKRTAYTKEDDDVIRKHLSNNSSIARALMASAQELDRTVNSVASRYHKKLKDVNVTRPRTSFTEEDDRVIINHLKETPTNIKEGLKRASVELEKSIAVVTDRYYRVLRKKSEYLALTCGSKAGFTHNVKNVQVDRKTGELPDQNLRHYMIIMKQLLELSPKERKKILNFFEEE